MLQKSYAFGKIVKRCLIDSTPQIELSCTKVTYRSHMVRSCTGVTCKSHVEGSRARGVQVGRGDLHLQMAEIIIVQTLLVKRKCQLVVRLKANKCYQGLLRSLSSSINLLVSDLCSGLWPLCRCYWQCNRYHPRICPNRIASHIALIVSLIVSLWLYCSGLVNCLHYLTSKSDRSKTQSSALMNHALTSWRPESQA